MTNKFFGILFVVVLVATGVLYYNRLEETNSLKEYVSQLKNENSSLINKAKENEKLFTEQTEQLQKELAALNKQITELEKCISEQSLSKAARKITKDSEGKAVTDYMSGLARMMEHSTLRDSTRASIREHSVNVIYGDFIKNNIMDKKEAETLKELLVDRAFARFGRNMEMLDPKLTCAQKKIVVKQIKDDRAKIDEIIKGMLSKDIFEKYLECEKKSREVLFVNRFNIKLSNESIQLLTRHQQKSLVNLIYKERVLMEKQPGYVNLEFACPEDLTDNNVRKFFQQEKVMDAKITEKSKNIFTKEQFTAFTVFLKHYNDELKRRVKLLRSVRRNKKKLAIC